MDCPVAAIWPAGEPPPICRQRHVSLAPDILETCAKVANFASPYRELVGLFALPYRGGQIKLKGWITVKLILHVGMSKSGSTAIQHGLLKLQDRLLEQGYLYPAGLLTTHNQSSLIVAAEPPNKLPRYFRPRYKNKPEQLERDFSAWIDGIRKQIDHSKPKIVLMSAQTLFKVSKPEQFEKLSAVLRPLADEIETVAYLRRPSDFYLSSAQQILKADHRIKPLAPLAYKEPLEGFRRISDRLHIFQYDRRSFPDGDVLRHFLENFCPDVPKDDLPSLEANVSLSAEGLSLLLDYRRKYHSNKPRQFTKDTSVLISEINKAENDLSGNRRPKLREKIARKVDEGSEDLLWLRDTYGIVFDGIDYARISPLKSRSRPKQLDDICEIDSQRKADLTLHTLHHLAGDLTRLRKLQSEKDEKNAPAKAARKMRTGRIMPATN
jgi:hypothetical protein